MAVCAYAYVICVNSAWLSEQHRTERNDTVKRSLIQVFYIESTHKSNCALNKTDRFAYVRVCVQQAQNEPNVIVANSIFSTGLPASTYTTDILYTSVSFGYSSLSILIPIFWNAYGRQVLDAVVWIKFSQVYLCSTDE